MASSTRDCGADSRSDPPRRARRAQAHARAIRGAASRDSLRRQLHFPALDFAACSAARRARRVARRVDQAAIRSGPRKSRQRRRQRPRRFIRRSARPSPHARDNSAGRALESFPRRSPAAKAPGNFYLPPAMNDERRKKLSSASLGHRGEGLVRATHGPVYIPGALPGELVLAQVRGERGKLMEILRPSLARIAPICPISASVAAARRSISAISSTQIGKSKSSATRSPMPMSRRPLSAMIDAHGDGRRRAIFHARFAAERAHVEVGFMQARAHRIIEIQACPILAPGMAGALGAARALAECLRGVGKPLDINVTATLTGLDFDIRGCGVIDFPARQKLIEAAGKLDIARLSNHGEMVIERRAPEILMGSVSVCPPPGGFLQATLRRRTHSREIDARRRTGRTPCRRPILRRRRFRFAPGLSPRCACGRNATVRRWRP